MEDVKNPSQTFADRNYVWDEKYIGCDQWKMRHYRRKDEWILRQQYLRREKKQKLLRNMKREQSVRELRGNAGAGADVWADTQGRAQAGRGDIMSESVSNFIKKEKPTKQQSQEVYPKPTTGYSKEKKVHHKQMAENQ